MYGAQNTAIFCRKNIRSFCSAKAPGIFSAKKLLVYIILCILEDLTNPSTMIFFSYGRLPKSSNTLNIRTLKIIAKYNFKMFPKISNSGLFSEIEFLKFRTMYFFAKKKSFSYFLPVFITVKICCNTVSQYI